MLPTPQHTPVRPCRQPAHICHGTGNSAMPRTSSSGSQRSRRTRDTASTSHGATDEVLSLNQQHRRPQGPPPNSRAAPVKQQSQQLTGKQKADSSSTGSLSQLATKLHSAGKIAARKQHPREVAARKNPELYSLTQQQTAGQNGQTSSRELAGQHQHDRQSTATLAQGQQLQLVIPWLASTAGSVVGSTGSFGPAVETAVASSSSNGTSPPQRLEHSSSNNSSMAMVPSKFTNRPSFKPEVLAPAGGWPQLRAAVENGADAVYFGVTGFNARARAANFESSELPEVMAYLHERGAKGYVALNILVFDEELPRLEQLVRQLASSGVDAVIVQDVGAVALIRNLAPNLAIHGSTQMSITSAEGAEFAASLGVTRVVVGRELSVKEISKLASSTGVEVEAFCHGALCVSYSGQCYSSEAWGGRSANRGQCAQACRMPYGLIVDGQIKDLADISYLLSPQDLIALEQVPDMINAGVGCFKIEGRLKGPEYVAATTAAYRAAVDAAWDQLLLEEQQHQERVASNSTTSSSSSSGNSSSIDPAVVRSLSQIFSRGQDEAFNGLMSGFLEGSLHQRLVRGRAPRHRGLCLGRVAAVTNRGVVIEQLLNPVKRGDGLVFDQGIPEKQEEGGAVWDMFAVDVLTGQQDSTNPASRRKARSSSRKLEGEAPEGSAVELVFGPNQVQLLRLSAGDLVWKSRDPALESRLRESYESVSSTTARKLPVQVTVSGSLGTPLQLTLLDPHGNKVVADTGDVVLQAASKRPLSAEDVIAAVGQLGDNSLAPSEVDVAGLALDQGLFLPASAFKVVRRTAAEQLLNLIHDISYDQNMAAEPVLPAMLEAATAASQHSGSSISSGSSSKRQKLDPTLRVLCRTPGQVEAALQVPWVQEVIVDFLEVHGLREAVAAVQAAGRQAVVALPRILKPDESRLLWFYLNLKADALLLRGAGCLQQLLELGGPGAVVHDITALSSSSSSSSSSSGNEQSDALLQRQPVTIPKLEGDFSLNAANVLAADLLLSQGLSRLCLTHDLNAAQLAALAESLGNRAAQLEAIVHQHLPIFHTEHCVFCRFLSHGNSYLDCGHPCERHTVELRDSSGADHLVLADMGCRNTVFNASAQSGLYYMSRLAAAGYGTFRIELVNESPHMVRQLLEGYRNVLKGQQQPGDVWSWLKDASKGGISSGSLDVKTERAISSLRPTARRQ